MSRDRAIAQGLQRYSDSGLRGERLAFLEQHLQGLGMPGLTRDERETWAAAGDRRDVIADAIRVYVGDRVGFCSLVVWVETRLEHDDLAALSDGEREGLQKRQGAAGDSMALSEPLVRTHW
jgi:hypothetical protein